MKKFIHHGNNNFQRTTAVSSQIDHERMCPLAFEFRQCRYKLIESVESECAHLDISDGVGLHISSLNTVHGNVSTSYGYVNQFCIIVSFNSQFYFGTFFTTKLLQYIGVCNFPPCNQRVIDIDYPVPLLYTCRLRGTARHNTCHYDRIA